MKNRCQLCGGQIRAGRCGGCGMDYSRRKTEYRLNENRLPESGEIGGKEERCREAKGAAREAYSSFETRAKAEDGGQRRNGKRAGGDTPAAARFLPMLALVLVMLAFMVVGMIRDKAGGLGTGRGPRVEVVRISDTLYDQASRALEPEGAGEPLELEPGSYLVGEGLPEGCYQVALSDEEEEAVLEVQDSENRIFFRRTLTGFYSGSQKEGVGQLHNVRLYRGAKLWIDGGSLIFIPDI